MNFAAVEPLVINLFPRVGLVPAAQSIIFSLAMLVLTFLLANTLNTLIEALARCFADRRIAAQAADGTLVLTEKPL